MSKEIEKQTIQRERKEREKVEYRTGRRNLGKIRERKRNWK